MTRLLSIELLKSFVAISESGSMIKAEKSVFLSQSALSLQMKRLAAIVGAPLFQRTHGIQSLTPAGEVLLRYARHMLALNDEALAALRDDFTGTPIRIGMTQDFVDQLLPSTLNDFIQPNPRMHVHIRLGNSASLREAMQSDQLDLALYLTTVDNPFVIRTVPAQWWGRPTLMHEAELPLVLMEKPCLFREAAIASLNAESRRFRIVLESSSTSVLYAAVKAGLGVTCRAAELINDGIGAIGAVLGPLPTFGYAIEVRPGANTMTSYLRNILARALQSPAQ